VVDATSGNVLKTISVSAGGYGEPSYVAVNETTNRVYVSLHAGGGLAVIDGAADTRLASINVCAGAFGVAADPELNRVYVSCRVGHAVETIDGATNTLIPAMRVSLTGEPYAMSLNAAGRRLYVSYAPEYSNPRQVLAYRVSGTALQWLGTASVGNGGTNGGGGMAVNEATGHIFVTNSQDDTVTVLDAGTLMTLATIPAGDDPMPVAIDPWIAWVYIGNRGSNTIAALPDTY
jgi:YVTN family beta-propeller protein